jgi:capsule biosynthesis phosphatase
MRICVDLDGTIAANKIAGEEYGDVSPIPGAIRVLTRLRDEGAYIIIHTARGMGTCNNNLGRVISKEAWSTVEWLKKWEVPYDELLFGKPNVDYFIDDKGVRFIDWDTIYNFLREEQNHV